MTTETRTALLTALAYTNGYHRSCDQRLEKLSRFVIGRVDIGAFHAPCEENSISLLEQGQQLFRRKPSSSYLRVVGRALACDPSESVSPYKVVPHNHTTVVELQSLTRKGATHLLQSFRSRRPPRVRVILVLPCRKCGLALFRRLFVPWSCPITNLNVAH